MVTVLDELNTPFFLANAIIVVVSVTVNGPE
jgi:hypothetical protein